jgi:hypothetical protein
MATNKWGLMVLGQLPLVAFQQENFTQLPGAV